jgi:hypothetical protein
MKRLPSKRQSEFYKRDGRRMMQAPQILTLGTLESIFRGSSRITTMESLIPEITTVTTCN